MDNLITGEGMPKLRAVTSPDSLADTRIQHQAALRHEELDSESKFDAARQEYWVYNNYLEAQGLSNFAPDYDWQMSDEEIAQWQEGLNEEYWDVLDEAVNAEHAQTLKQRALDTQQRNEVIFNDGIVKGLGIGLGTSIIDPAALGITVATEGALAPYVLANKASRIGNMVRHGLLSAGSNVAVDSVLASYNPTMDSEDLMYSALGGATLGGAFGALSKVQKVSQDIRKEQNLELIQEQGLDLSDEGKQVYKDFLDEEGNIVPTSERIKKVFDSIEDPEDTFGSWARIDRSATLASSSVPETRKLGKILMHDAAGKSVAGEDAYTWKELFAGRTLKNFNESFQTNFKSYLKEKGKSTTGSSLKHRDRTAFNFEVSRALQGDDSVSSSAKAHAATMRQTYEEFGERLVDPKKGESKGNSVALSEGYLEDYKQPRVWNANKLLEYRKKHGEEGLHNTIARAIVGIEDMATRMRIAKHLTRSVTATKDPRGLDIEQVLNTKDIDDLKDLLRERTALNEDELSEIAKTLAAKVDEKTDDAGKTSRLKHRIELDELSEGISDLIEMDSERLFLNYVNSMSGHIALARQGIGSRKDFDQAIKQVRDAYDEKLLKTPANKVGKLERQRDREINVMEAAYKNLIGQPLETDPSSVGSQSMRLLGKYNFVRLMNQMGFAQLSELGVVLTQNTLKSTIQHVPELRKMLKRAKTDSKFADQLLDEISDAMGGWGSERIMNQVSNRIDEQGTMVAGRSAALDKVETTLDHAARLTSDISGFSVVDHMLKNLQMKGMAQDFYNLALKDADGIKKAFTDSGLKKRQQRMAAIGLTEEKFKPIAQQLSKYASVNDKGKLTKLNLEQWDDLDALNDFQIAMRLEGERTVVTPSFGDLPVWGTGTTYGIEGPLGKALWQFKRFIAVAHTKLLMNGFKYRDAQTVVMFLSSSMTAALAITAQTHINSFGRADKDKYLDDRLSPENLAKGVFQRSAWAGFMPMAIDAHSPLTGEALFKYRSSGLGADPITGTPMFNLFTSLSGASQGAFQAATDPTTQYSQQDFRQQRSILPFQNAMVINNGLNVIQSDLPKFSK